MAGTYLCQRRKLTNSNMTTKTEVDKYGWTFQWKIGNLSYCWLKSGEGLKSPTFTAYGMEGTKWSLMLYPRGKTEESYVALHLYRERDCCGPKTVEINYELGLLDENGRLLTARTIPVRDFEKGSEWGFQKFEVRKKIFDTERKAFLPKNTLTVLCTIWNTYEKPSKSNLSFATTVIKVTKRSFIWKIDKFTTFVNPIRNKFKEDLIDLDIYLVNKSVHRKELYLEIISFDENIKYFSFQASHIDFKGNRLNFGIKEFLSNSPKKGTFLIANISTFQWDYTGGSTLGPDTVLFDCEYAFSTGIAFNSSEDLDFGVISPNITPEVITTKDETFAECETYRSTSDLAEDLKSLHCVVALCDTELRTLTGNFPAHKTILGARSSVFRRMFSNDMKEKNSGHVDVTDLEEDTVSRMLVYMYTDSLEDLQFESAFNLYAAADKYQIPSLKNRCSSFLKENLSPTKVCDVSILADLHQDSDLKCFVQNYIAENEKEVFGSQEWIEFMKTNVILAADIMYRKVFPK